MKLSYLIIITALLLIIDCAFFVYQKGGVAGLFPHNSDTNGAESKSESVVDATNQGTSNTQEVIAEQPALTQTEKSAPAETNSMGQCQDEKCLESFVFSCTPGDLEINRTSIYYGKNYSLYNIEELPNGNCKLSTKFILSNPEATIIRQEEIVCISDGRIGFDGEPLFWWEFNLVYSLLELSQSLKDPEWWEQMKLIAEKKNINPDSLCKITLTDLSPDHKTPTTNETVDTASSIKKMVFDLRQVAESYFSSQSPSSYSGLCQSTEVKESQNTIEKLGTKLNCKDSAREHRNYAMLPDKTYACSDSFGQAKIITKPPLEESYYCQ